MKGFPGGMQQFVKQANQLQTKLKKLQEELEVREYEASSGGGAVKVKIKGDSEILNLEISEDVFKGGDKEMLQDLVLTAVNEVLKVSKATSQAEMEKLTGNVKMPGMF
ncbi:MAG: YbaB/EbfC family nucleoid-associated protein [Pseudomonadota bacterium]|nr:YbaB/EbfC family nucleoid-associated protein [Pseudomonadota bacterium]